MTNVHLQYNLFGGIHIFINTIKLACEIATLNGIYYYFEIAIVKIEVTYMIALYP